MCVGILEVYAHVRVTVCDLSSSVYIMWGHAFLILLLSVKIKIAFIAQYVMSCCVL